MITLFDFLLLTLASFRFTRLLVVDTITEIIRRPFHQIMIEEHDDGTVVEYIEVKGTGLRFFIGTLLSCYWCTGIWCSLFLFMGWTYWRGLTYPIVLVLAIAGVASFFESVIRRITD